MKKSLRHGNSARSTLAPCVCCHMRAAWSDFEQAIHALTTRDSILLPRPSLSQGAAPSAGLKPSIHHLFLWSLYAPPEALNVGDIEGRLISPDVLQPWRQTGHKGGLGRRTARPHAGAGQLGP